MARFFTGLFGSSKQTQPPITSLRINTSVQGVPIALHLGGAQRLAGNLIDYFGFNYQNAPQASGGGKGGLGGGGGGKGQTSGSYNYFTSMLIALCEGPISNVTGMWVGGAVASQPPFPPGGIDGFGQFLYQAEVTAGTLVQTAWGYVQANEPARALNYRGICYAAFGNFPLGSSTSLPNFTFEVVSSNAANVINGQLDGDASIALQNFLTNVQWGLNFPAARLGSLANWQSYCTALGLAVSPVISSPVSAASFVNDLAAATNAAPCWQDGAFTIIPYGDAAATAGAIVSVTETYVVPADQSGTDSNGVALYFPAIRVTFYANFAGDEGVNYLGAAALSSQSFYAPTGYNNTGTPLPGQYVQSGGIYYFSPGDIGQTVQITYAYALSASYVPVNTPIYAFTSDDFLPNQGTIGSGLSPGNSAVIVVRKARDQMLNTIKVEYLDRNNSYNPVDIEVKDEASIVTYGRVRPSDIRQYHFFCLAGAAQQSATLALIREQTARTFQFTVGRHFLLILELMSLATVTDPAQGLNLQPVRITEIQENTDFSITVTAEEFLGTVSAPAYGSQPNSGYTLNYNAAPGQVNAPILFEPTDQLNQTNGLGSLQVWAAVSGQNLALWGGCYVWVSYDGQNYQKIGEITGPARMGLSTASLPAVTPNPTGQATVDNSNTLSLSLAESGGTLSSGTQGDALALNTACYLGGEILSYATATLTGANAYNLTYLVRGAYGTEADIASHPIGTPFARLDQNVFAFAYDQSRIGATIYLKFQSFNIYQGGEQSLAQCAAYPYVITGAALASPLPTITNLRTVYDVNSGFTELAWDDITDFRAFRYEIRSGTSFAAALSLGRVAHPPYRVPGNGTYWVAAVATPVAGLTVYSEAWQDVTVSGAILTQNIVLQIDLKAAGWPGVFTGGAGLDSTLNAIRTGGGNILSAASILATTDMLNYGGGATGMYYPSQIAFVDIGYVANASVSIQYQPTGLPVGQNVLTVGDFLNDPDVLGSASSQYVSVYPMIQTASSAAGDLYSLGDLFQYPDLYIAGAYNWSAFQRFSPGTYQARALNFAVLLETFDPLVIAYDLALVMTITIPSRVDTYAATSSATAATTIIFEPTGAATPAPFNGGAGPGNLPAITWGIINAQAGDDLLISALSLASITFTVVNAGAQVARNLNLFAEGY